METNEAQTLPDIRVRQATTVACPKCGKEFKNEIGLRMHTLRAHSGRGWDTSANFHRGGKIRQINHEEFLAKKREYNRKVRERYKLEGKDSRGYPLKGHRGGNKGMNLPKWSPERLAKFRRTMRRKALVRSEARKAGRIQIVYPDPREKEQEEKNWQVVIPQMEYCPHCGEYLKAWRYQA